MHRIHYKERVSFNDEKAHANNCSICGNGNTIFGNHNRIVGDNNTIIGDWNYSIGSGNSHHGNDNINGEAMDVDVEVSINQGRERVLVTSKSVVPQQQNFEKIPAESLQAAPPGSEMMSFVGHYQIEPTESQAGHLLMKHEIAPSRPHRVYGKPMKMAAPAGELRCYMGDPQGLGEWHAKWDAEKEGNHVGIQLKEPDTLEQLYAMDRNDLMRLYDDGFISKEQLSKVQFHQFAPQYQSDDGYLSPILHHPSRISTYQMSNGRPVVLVSPSSSLNQFIAQNRIMGDAMQNDAHGMIQNHNNNNNIDGGYPPSLEVDGGYRVFKSGSMRLNMPREENSIQNNNAIACSPAPMVYEQQKGKLEVPTEEEAEKHDIESDDPNNVCITCLENKPICVIIPCMHAIMCCECARTVAPTLCPKCRDPTQRIVRLKM